MTDTIHIQNLDPDNSGIIVSTSVEVHPINLGDVGGEDFLNVVIKWSGGGRDTILAMDPDGTDKLISELVRALLELRGKRATICLADLTAVRIDAAAETIAVDHHSGTPAGGGWPEWRIDDRRDHVYGDFSCHDTSDCAGCGTRPATDTIPVQ